MDDLGLSDPAPSPDRYAAPHDAVRATLETSFFAETVPTLLAFAGGGRLVDLGCGDAVAQRLGGPRLESYVGVDLVERGAPSSTARWVAHDLRDGLGPVGGEPFDVYFGGFGVASHLTPADLGRLLREIAGHARPGSVVALEALGLYSLEWPGLWSVPPGPGRVLPYQLGGEVEVHPWSPAELRSMFHEAGFDWLWTVDRSVQMGPKVGADGYWPELPPLRCAMNGLLQGDAGSVDTLWEPLPALPAHRAARLHRRLGCARAQLAESAGGTSPQLVAQAVWSLERGSYGGYGHGVVAVGRRR